MLEVKIREVTKNITTPGIMGMETNQPHNELKMYFSETGEEVPDGNYTLKQGEQEEACFVYGGRVREVEWVDHNQAMFLI
jgi:hypothetical protein